MSKAAFFKVENDNRWINELRRVSKTRVPTVAIDVVHVYENNSCVHDEMLAQRLGLVPLDIDPSKFADDEEVEFTLKASTMRETTELLSGSLQGPYKPLIQDIVLTKLDPNQSVNIVAIAKKGVGEVHAKWNPVSSFKRVADDTVYIETTGVPVQYVFETAVELMKG